jgi:hypothetical protein
MKSIFWSRGWKGFITRTLTIVIVLLAINYMVKNTETSQTEQIESQHHPQATMNIKHEVIGKDLHLHVELSNFQLSLNSMDKESELGQGHIHLYVDDEKVTKIFEPEYVLKGLEPGVHLIRLELAHNDHESYGVEETFSITIEE